MTGNSNHQGTKDTKKTLYSFILGAFCVLVVNPPAPSSQFPAPGE